MAEPKKTTQGTWRILIEVKGVRDSVTLPTKRECIEWRDRRVMELRAVAAKPAGQRTSLLQVLRRYADEVSPAKRGNAKELIRLRAFERHPLPTHKPIADVTTADLIAWRDARLAVNERGSVLRDISLLSSVFEMARRDWGLIADNPMRDVRKPAQPDHRQRLITGTELRAMLRSLGYSRRQVRTVSQSVALCALLALFTGMRAGELCGLLWGNVYPTHVRLPLTKNGDSRDVPLSRSARRVLDAMRGWDGVSVFALTPQTLDALWRRHRVRCGLTGFTFHDLRHSAATAMAKRLHVLELCKVMGWRRTDQALTYFNPHAADLALRLG